MTDDTQDVTALAAENARLRAELEAENAKLQTAIDEATSATAGGLTDEDVRRLEHPEEFADEAEATVGGSV